MGVAVATPTDLAIWCGMSQTELTDQLWNYVTLDWQFCSQIDSKVVWKSGYKCGFSIKKLFSFRRRGTWLVALYTMQIRAPTSDPEVERHFFPQQEKGDKSSIKYNLIPGRIIEHHYSYLSVFALHGAYSLDYARLSVRVHRSRRK